MIRLAEHLGAYVSTPYSEPPLTDPLYIPENSLGLLGPVDVTVVVRDWRGVFLPVQTRKRFFWSGDAADQPINIGLGDERVLARVDKILCVSEWQKATLQKATKISDSKLDVLPNGVHAAYFKNLAKKTGNRIIYTSTPNRGLVHLERLFPRIRERVPDAELIVCSGYAVYQDEKGRFDRRLLAQWGELREKLKAIKGVSVVGNLLQEQLAQEFLKAKVLAYPNTFAETSCISAMEAITARCVPLTTDRGALRETIKGNGICLQGVPGEVGYDEQFVSQCVRLLTDESYRSSFLQPRNFDWSGVAKKFQQLVTSG